MSNWGKVIFLVGTGIAGGRALRDPAAVLQPRLLTALIFHVNVYITRMLLPVAFFAVLKVARD